MWTSGYSQYDPRPRDARGVARPNHGPEGGPGRGAGLTLWDVTTLQHGCCRGPKANFVSWDATSNLHAHSEGCFGVAGPPHAALFRLAWTSRYSQSNPRGGNARGVARHKLGPRMGAGKKGGADTRGRDPWQHGCCQGPQARQSSSPGNHPAVFTPSQKAALGWLDPHSRPFSGLSWTSGYSQSVPLARNTRFRARPKPGPRRWAGTRGGADARGHDPCNMAAAGVPMQSSSSWGGRKPHAGPFSGIAWTSGYSQYDPRPRDARGMVRPKLGSGRVAGLTLGEVTPCNMAADGVPRQSSSPGNPIPGPGTLGAWLDPSPGREEGRG